MLKNIQNLHFLSADLQKLAQIYAIFYFFVIFLEDEESQRLFFLMLP